MAVPSLISTGLALEGHASDLILGADIRDQCRTTSRSLSPMFIDCPLTSPRVLLHDLFVYLRLMRGRQRGVDSFEDIGYRSRGADLVA